LNHPLRKTGALISPFWLKKYFKFLVWKKKYALWQVVVGL
jgi:hypothetical protein